MEEGAESLGLGTAGCLAPPPSLVSNEDNSGDLTAPVSPGILLEASTDLCVQKVPVLEKGEMCSLSCAHPCLQSARPERLLTTPATLARRTGSREKG